MRNFFLSFSVLRRQIAFLFSIDLCVPPPSSESERDDFESASFSKLKTGLSASMDVRFDGQARVRIVIRSMTLTS